MAVKATLTWLLLAALAAPLATAPAQKAEARGPAAGPGLTVVSFDWKYSGYERAETVKGSESIPNTDTSTSIKLSRAKVYVFKYIAKVTLKNEGQRGVKAVSWDYVFTDGESGKELKRYRLQSKQQVLPGETQTLSAGVGLDPKESARHISTGKQSVEVVRIEYADGSIWKKE